MESPWAPGHSVGWLQSFPCICAEERANWLSAQAFNSYNLLRLAIFLSMKDEWQQGGEAFLKKNVMVGWNLAGPGGLLVWIGWRACGQVPWDIWQEWLARLKTLLQESLERLRKLEKNWFYRPEGINWEQNGLSKTSVREKPTEFSQPLYLTAQVHGHSGIFVPNPNNCSKVSVVSGFFWMDQGLKAAMFAAAIHVPRRQSTE